VLQRTPSRDDFVLAVGNKNLRLETAYKSRQPGMLKVEQPNDAATIKIGNQEFLVMI
jgi:hypothetical protein